MASKRRDLAAWAGPLIFTVILFAAAEIVLRLAGFQYALTPIGLRYATTIAGIGGVNRGFHVTYALDPVLLWKPVYTQGSTNSDGFIGPEWKKDKSPGTKRVVVMGDSCTIAGDPTYPEILGKKLPGNIEVLNAGVGSWSSYQGLQLLRTRLLAFKPDAVTIYFGWNDHWLAWSAPDKDLSRVISNQWRVRNAANSSRVLQALMKLIVWARGGPRFGPATPYRVAIDDYESNLREMVRLIQSIGAKAVLVTAPTVLTPDHPVTRQLCEDTHNFFDPKQIRSTHAAYNERVRRVANDTGATLVDLEKDFATTPDPRVYFTDGIHLTAAGHERAAAALRRALARLGF